MPTAYCLQHPRVNSVFLAECRCHLNLECVGGESRALRCKKSHHEKNKCAWGGSWIAGWLARGFRISEVRSASSAMRPWSKQAVQSLQRQAESEVLLKGSRALTMWLHLESQVGQWATLYHAECHWCSCHTWVG